MNVLITGATKGIGKAIAEKFAAEGASLFVCARNRKDLQSLQKMLAGKTSASVFAEPCDVTDKKQIGTFASKVKKRWSRVDVLVNNAGVFLPGNVTDEKESVMEQIMAVNFFSAFYLTRALLPLMLSHRSGHIFNLCSVASLKAYPHGGMYSVSKHALLGLSRAFREELKPHNIRVTTLLPGATYTPSWAGVNLPEDRFMSADDLAGLVYDIHKVSERTVVEDIVIRPMLGDI